ncbi:LacI family DNA-binding transcriptional regulator [Microbacterium halophytorum]|uniref:LacI family DNA-binding transcriptional regulator n=1 Tax=Microbacterium halophytorum TaxID=2067568 RepID=UPI001E29E8F8|nr:substrate-binding domain-containing protein [Microbacterium halophytorum]
MSDRASGSAERHPARPSGATGRVSLVQVAALAGVSGQTVSRVVNGSARVDPATRTRVEEAMAELGYRPNRAARALRTGRTGLVGVVVTTLATVGNSRMLQAVVEKAADRGYGVTVATVAGPEGVASAFARLRAQGVDGAIVLNEASALASGAIPDDVPAAIVDAPPGEAAAATISSRHREGARAAVAHLSALGHRRIVHLAGPEGSYAAAEREAGWREGLAAARDRMPPVADSPRVDHDGAPAAASRGRAPIDAAHAEVDAASRPACRPVDEAAGDPGGPQLTRGDWSADSGFAAAEAIAASGATAVFSANDQMALGLIRGLGERGIEVPRDVSVVGFDDVPDAANYRPPLTTVHQDFPELAARAVDALLAQIEAPGALRHDTVPAPLVARESTASARRIA